MSEDRTPFDPAPPRQSAIATWHGRPIADMSRDELIALASQLARELGRRDAASLGFTIPIDPIPT